MKRTLRFLRDYRYFSLALVALLISWVFQASGQHHIVKWILTIVASLELLPMLWIMWQDFRSGDYGLNILAPASIITAIVLNQYWTAIVIVLMFTGGKAIEKYAKARAKNELNILTKRIPKKAQVIHKGKVSEVKVSDLHIGEKIVLKTGQVVPIDSIIIDGSAQFDESAVTGESAPQAKQINDQVVSGAVILDGQITIKAVAEPDESHYQQIIKLVRGASAQKAPFVKLAIRYTLPFTFAAFAIGGTAWALTDHAIRFLDVLVVATPCPLLLAVPLSITSGMSRASRYGIIMKTGSALEKLADAETIIFNKGGTLTSGNPVVESVQAFDPYQEEDIISLAASLEQNSKHALAYAIINEAALKQIKITKSKHATEIKGRGLVATIKGKQVLVGRLSLFEDEEIVMPNHFKAKQTAHSSVYVAIDHVLAGIIYLSDEPRSESRPTVQLLNRHGLKNTYLMTGDNTASADALAKELGIAKVYADMMPADKLHVLDAITARPIVFVGHGLQDTPSMIASNVGIALGAKNTPTSASESADIIVMADNIGYVAYAYQIARRSLKIAQQSVYLGIGLDLILMLIFATGKILPVYGALVLEVLNIAVIFYALRAHSGKSVTL